ncbi:MAG: hypothetical protein JWP03_798 [Phycisphaerales bacterium]|jgi:ElaB/YqjD/DUF883 family membrane-anchored ribosome-binding protein|nr:hypothetical protein [Phycisphaerales bacterium]
MSDAHQKAAKAARTAERTESEVAAKANEAGQLAQDAGHAVCEAYGRVSDRGHKSFDRARDAAGRWERGLESSVQRRPLVAVFAAAAVGLLLGILFTRRNRN